MAEPANSIWSRLSAVTLPPLGRRPTGRLPTSPLRRGTEGVPQPLVRDGFEQTRRLPHLQCGSARAASEAERLEQTARLPMRLGVLLIAVGADRDAAAGAERVAAAMVHKR